MSRRADADTTSSDGDGSSKLSYGQTRAQTGTIAGASESSAEKSKGLLTRFQTHERVVARATRSKDLGGGSIASEDTSLLGSEHGDASSVNSWRMSVRGVMTSPVKSEPESAKRGTASVKPNTSGSFDIAENARLALEAKDVQLAKMAARLEAVMREKQELEASRSRGEMSAFASQADDLDAEMKAALRGLRGNDRASNGYDMNGLHNSTATVNPFARRGDEGGGGLDDDSDDEAPGPSRRNAQMPNGATRAQYDDDDGEDNDGHHTPQPPSIKPGVRVEGGYLTPSGRVVGSALKTESSALKSVDGGGTNDRRVVFNHEEQFSDAGAPFEAVEVAELRRELREIRGALKSAFSVSEQLVEQCEKKNMEIKEKNAALKLAREELLQARDDLRAAREGQNEAEKRTNALLRGDFNVDELRRHLSTTLRALDDSNAFAKECIKIIQQSVGVNVELSPDVVFSILPVLSSLSIRGEMAEAMVDAGVLNSLVNALEMFKSDGAICADALDAIQAICRTGLDAAIVTQDEQLIALRGTLTDDAIKTCARSVVACGHQCVSNAVVCEAIAGVALAFAEFGDFPNIQYLVGECEMVDVLVQSCVKHANDEGVQRATTCALAAYAVCDGSTKRVVESLGGFALIKRCVNELNVDDAVRLFPPVRRWISSSKSSSRTGDQRRRRDDQRERAEAEDLNASDDDIIDDATLGDNL